MGHNSQEHRQAKNAAMSGAFFYFSRLVSRGEGGAFFPLTKKRQALGLPFRRLYFAVSRNASSAARARSAIFWFFSFFGTRCGSGGMRPKFTFMGWKFLPS